MNGKTNQDYQIERFAKKTDGRFAADLRRPFWMPAVNYYILTTAVSVAFFFLVWGIFHEGEEEMPWAIAFISAILIFGSAVAAREVFLRKTRQRFLLAERRLDYNLQNLSTHIRHEVGETNKLSLEKNAAIIKEIQKKSESARILGKPSDEHREVFEICNQYLSVAGKQLETVRVGSPRLAGLRRGREIVGELHRHHLLSWAEMESRSLTQKAGNYVTISEKLNTAQEALAVLNSALQFYPDEPRLIESEAALKNFIASVKVSHWIEQAERAAFKGNYKRAVSLYRDALFFLAREDVKTEERELIAGKINSEIESLRERSANKKLS